MRTVMKYIGELIGAVVQGCLVMAILAAVVATGAYYLAHKAMPQGLDLAFVLVIVIMAGIIGALARLVWRLTHLHELAQVASQVAQRATKG
ncbi:MAG: hypothetical protein ACHQ4H_16455 [Ktedonobacterales bacterium]